MANIAASPASNRARTRSALTNRPLAGVDLTTAEGRRLRDLYQLAAAEIGGRLNVKQSLVALNWARLQQRLEQMPTSSFNVVLATEVRHSWKQVLAQKRSAPKRVQLSPLERLAVEAMK